MTLKNRSQTTLNNDIINRSQTTVNNDIKIYHK